MKIINKESGSTLIIGLILLIASSLIAIASMSMSQLNERAASNQSLKLISLMAAETGAGAFSTWILNPSNTWESTGWQSNIPITKTGAPNAGTYGYYFVENPASDITWTNTNVVIRITGAAKNDSSDNLLAKTVLELHFRDTTSSAPSPAFGAGMLSDEDIDLKGNCTISGSLHANGSISCTGGASSHVSGSGAVSAVGSINLANMNANEKFAGASSRDVPKVNDDVITNMLNLFSGRVINNCSPSVSGDGGGAVYYCAGNMSVSGSHSNVTFLSGGNITYNGSGQRGGGDKSASASTVAVIAKGGITFNGSSTAYGIFWSGGEYVHNGSGSVNGSIVAGLDIRRNGSFSFTQNSEVDNDTLPSTTISNRSMLYWRELL